MFSGSPFPRVPFLASQQEATAQQNPAGTAAPPAIPFDALVSAAAEAKTTQNRSAATSILSRYEAVAPTVKTEDAQHLLAALVFLGTRDSVTRRRVDND